MSIPNDLEEIIKDFFLNFDASKVDRSVVNARKCVGAITNYNKEYFVVRLLEEDADVLLPVENYSLLQLDFEQKKFELKYSEFSLDEMLNFYKIDRIPLGTYVYIYKRKNKLVWALMDDFENYLESFDFINEDVEFKITLENKDQEVPCYSGNQSVVAIEIATILKEQNIPDSKIRMDVYKSKKHINSIYE